MARPFRRTYTATLADDNYHRFSDLVGADKGLAMLEGFLGAQTNGFTWRIGPSTTPAATEAGDPIVANSGRGFGPVRDVLAGWWLDELWVRNTLAGSNATVVLNAVLEPIHG